MRIHSTSSIHHAVSLKTTIGVISLTLRSFQLIRTRKRALNNLTYECKGGENEKSVECKKGVSGDSSRLKTLKRFCWLSSAQSRDAHEQNEADDGTFENISIVSNRLSPRYSLNEIIIILHT